jgi:hypothetical protein
MKATSRSKQLQRYKGNWATLEIIKTLIKNRRSYKNRLGSIDEDNDGEFSTSTSKDEDGKESEGVNIDDMYVDEDENGGKDINHGEGEDEDEDEGKDINHGEDEDEDEDEDGRKDVGWGADENGLEELGGDDDERRDGEGSHNVKQAGRKRKVTQDDELVTATRGKLRKTMGSSGEQKKALPKGRKYKR